MKSLSSEVGSTGSLPTPGWELEVYMKSVGNVKLGGIAKMKKDEIIMQEELDHLTE